MLQTEILSDNCVSQSNKYQINQALFKLGRRYLLWFSPLVALPLLWLRFSPPLARVLPQIPEKPDFVANPVTFSKLDRELEQSSPDTLQKLQPHSASQKLAKTPKRLAKATSPQHRRKHKVKHHASYAAPAIEIRVAIAQDANNLEIASSTKASILDLKGHLIEHLPASQAFAAQASNSTIFFKDWQTPSSIWIVPTRGGAVFVGDRWYRGKLLLVAQADKLLAINYVNLEQYLASVVGSEMSAAAPLEALKAQAIAARSYALVHIYRPASAWYNLGNNERWQAYKGIASEYNTTHQAVNATSGQILSYQGGIVESLYAATDEIVSKAHKGTGMSQTGAYSYASAGYSYQQILAVYYPGTQIARLQAR